MRNVTYKILMALMVLLPHFCLAQSTGSDFMRSIGKIYVVVGVIVAIFIGLVFFMISLDRRLTKLEHQHNKDE